MNKSTILGLMLLSLIPFVTQANDVNSSFIKDIKSAQNKLNRTETNIAKEKAALSTQLSRIENRVLKLRDQTALARRISDEKTLSLDQLQTRLKQWQQQSVYQNNLLQRFAQQSGLTLAKSDESGLADSELTHYLADLRGGLSPQWREADVAMEDGRTQAVLALDVGPVSWYVDNAAQKAGLLIKGKSSNNAESGLIEKSGLLFGDEVYQSLNQLAQSGEGSITLDPTLTRAVKLRGQQESVAQHVEKGGVWALPILAFGVFALVISLAKAVQLWRLPQIQPAISERLGNTLAMTSSEDRLRDQQHIAEKVKGMQSELVEIALKVNSGTERDDKLFASLLESKHTLEYWLGAIAITAAVAPLLGLLGTVSGMIETFKLMTLFGAGDASAVSGGISEALVTTELGLIVAIPALLLHALLSRKAKTYYGQLESCAIHLSQLQPELK